MNIFHKLVLLALGPAALILGVGHYASRESERSLRNLIERMSIAQSRGIMGEIDYVVHTRIAEWRAYSRSQIVQSTLRESNAKLASEPDPKALIESADLEWRKQNAENRLLHELIRLPLSRDLRARLDQLKLPGGAPVYGEVFVTNRFGANAAQTNRTSDYRQDDEEWWQLARKNGVHIGDMAFDESSDIYSTDICLRVDDEKGEFLGVLKVVLNIQEAISILDRRVAEDDDCYCRMTLLTSDDRLIHTTDESLSIERVESLRQNEWSTDGSVQAIENRDVATGKPMLTTFAYSNGFDEFPGLGWRLVSEVSADEVFAPVEKPGNNVLLVSAMATGLSALLGLLLALSLSKRIRRLTHATKSIQNGNQYTVVPVTGHDELSELAVSFNHMSKGLSGARQALESQAQELEARNALLENEVNQRRRSEKDRQDLNQKLLESSRQAGMAEVATGVLHNVGNVLNSVNVTASLLIEQLDDSHLGKLLAAARIINDQGDDLGEFLTNNERGRHFPKLLNELTKNLLEERELQVSELQELVDHVEHIKQVVSAQQSLARHGGQYEPVDLERLVQDALNIAQSGLRRHHVTVELNCDSMQPITTDKHKVLQVLVNLIANAKDAVGQRPVDDRRLAISVEKGTDVRIRVADNGIGIHPDHLTKIFSHGFSTKSDGHGFGLHSCAVAAQAIGGSLTAFSEGVDKGAVFTITIPTKQKTKACRT